MTITTKITLVCATRGCPSIVEVAGVSATRKEIYVKSKKLGWQWKSWEEHLCPTHKSRKKVAKPAKVAKLKATVKAKAAKVAAPKPVAKPVDKPAPVWSPTAPSDED